MTCHGRGTDHCCYIGGKVCPYLEEGTVEGRRWACGLFVKYGTWEHVYESVEYQATDIARWFSERFPGYGCGDWPQEMTLPTGTGRCCYG